MQCKRRCSASKRDRTTGVRYGRRWATQPAAVRGAALQGAVAGHVVVSHRVPARGEAVKCEAVNGEARQAWGTPTQHYSTLCTRVGQALA